MDTNAKVDATIFWQPRVALDHAVLDLDGAAHRVDDAAEFDDRAVAGALDQAAVVDGDRRINEVAAQSAQPRQRAVLVRAGQSAETDDVGGQNRGKFSDFGHRTSFTGPR